MTVSRNARIPGPSVRRLTQILVVALAVGLLVNACVADESDEGKGQGDDVTQENHSHDETASDAELSEVPLSDSEVTVVVANSPGTLVPATSQRLMTAILDPSGVGYLGSAQDPIEVVVRPVDAPGAADSEQRLNARWLSAHEAGLGLYLSEPVFDAAGIWEVRIESQGTDIGGTLVEVAAEPVMPLIGSAAPPSDSPTSAGRSDLTAISTDTDPNPTFYELSIGDAVTSGTPTVIAFATPAFCQTALCGPTMEHVRETVAGRSDLNVVHVEPYDLTEARSGNLVPVPAMVEWNLPTEPWVFVVDGSGTITAAFEGIFGADELSAALDALDAG
ncbi:MAG: hypothetical protein OEW83_00585 [Acidimicrobiia bacterium]|nr:hypothetical protein [Acidimicrobiia bacterium]